MALYAHALMDRSGSMTACIEDAVGGYNSYVHDAPPDSVLSLTIFDSISIDTIRDRVAPTMAMITDDEFKPRGNTPLYDAIGETVHRIERNSAGFDRIALVIVTDGHENASRTYKADQIAKLLADKQERDGWLVIYLGANQDAWGVGQTIGTSQAHTAGYAPQALREAYGVFGQSLRRFAGSSGNVQQARVVAALTAEERERLTRPRR